MKDNNFLLILLLIALPGCANKSIPEHPIDTYSKQATKIELPFIEVQELNDLVVIKILNTTPAQMKVGQYWGGPKMKYKSGKITTEAISFESRELKLNGSYAFDFINIPIAGYHEFRVNLNHLVAEKTGVSLVPDLERDAVVFSFEINGKWREVGYVGNLPKRKIGRSSNSTLHSKFVFS